MGMTTVAQGLWWLVSFTNPTEGGMDLMANLYNFCTLCLTANYLSSAEFINLDYGAIAPLLCF
jgi:hypothetical protein